MISVPLDELRVSALNARRRDTKSLDDLAASIATEGLLQNLTVTDGANGYEIVAGKRRYQALLLLRERSELPPELELVPCRLVHNGRAESASLAENIVREAMHPADEFEAFKRLAEQGKSVEEIAQEFGTMPIVVQRRLKLASVAPSLFALFRQDEIGLDQMMALAVSDDHTAQLSAWNVENHWERSADAIRRRLAKGNQRGARCGGALRRYGSDRECRRHHSPRSFQ
jgi:ParB family chromosome partitioning protein